MKAEYDFSNAKRGAVIARKGQSRISLFIDTAALAELRARAERAGTGYDELVNEALRLYLAQADGSPGNVTKVPNRKTRAAMVDARSTRATHLSSGDLLKAIKSKNA